MRSDPGEAMPTTTISDGSKISALDNLTMIHSAEKAEEGFNELSKIGIPKQECNYPPEQKLCPFDLSPLISPPNLVDRLIQQAIVQILTPIFDPSFSTSSYGFRPKRSAHGAAKQVQKIIKRGYRFAVDMDLSKFFDRVRHDILIARVARKVHDKPLLQMIGRYLRAGVMVDSSVTQTTL